MSIWTINDGTTDFDIDDLPVGEITLRFRNQAPDSASFDLNLNAGDTVPPPLAAGTVVTIRKSATTVFRGTMQTATNRARPNSEGLTVEALNAWDDLMRMPYGQYFDYSNGNTTLTPRVTVGGDPTTWLENNWWDRAELAGLLQKGTVDLPSQVLDEKEDVNITWAVALRNLLRKFPGAVVAFDYTFNPPKMHVLKADSSALISTTVDIADGEADYNWRERTGLQFSKVTIFYERAHRQITSLRLNDGTDRVTSSDGFELVSGDNHPLAGPMFAPGALATSHVLGGTKVSKTIQFHFVELNNKLNYFLAFDSASSSYKYVGELLRITGVPVFFHPALGVYGPSDVYKYCVSVQYSTQRVSTFGPATFDPGIVSPVRRYVEAGITADELPPKELWGAEHFHLYKITLNSLWSSSPGGAASERRLDDLYVTAHEDQGQGFAPLMSTTIDETVDDLEPAPTGLAQTLFDYYGANQYQGGITLARPEAEIPAALARVARITDGASTLAEGHAQSILVRLKSGQTTLSFGPADHLGPKDLLAALLA